MRTALADSPWPNVLEPPLLEGATSEKPRHSSSVDLIDCCGHSSKERGSFSPQWKPSTDPVACRPKNRLLSSLPAGELERILPHLTRVSIRRRQILQEPHAPSPYAYFIEQGAVSVMARTRSDGPIGVGLLGRFDFVGLPIVLGTMRSPLRALALIPGEALRIDAEDFRRCMDESVTLRHILLRYVQTQMVHSAQLTLCSIRHNSCSRLARWLLLAQDRLDDNEICITHTLIGKILGLRRASVTEAVGKLEGAGIVRRGRGCITIVDRRLLEQISCECYRAIRAEYEHLFSISTSDQHDLQRTIEPAARSSRALRCD